MSLQKTRRYDLTHIPHQCVSFLHIKHDSEMVMTFKGKSFCQVPVVSLHCLFDYWVYWKCSYCHTACLSFIHCFLLISPYPALHNWFIFILELIFFSLTLVCLFLFHSLYPSTLVNPGVSWVFYPLFWIIFITK